MFRRNIPYRKKMTETKETKRTNHWLTKAIWTHSKHYTPWWNTESFSFRNRNKASCLLSPLLFDLVLEFLPSHPVWSHAVYLRGLATQQPQGTKMFTGLVSTPSTSFPGRFLFPFWSTLKPCSIISTTAFELQGSWKLGCIHRERHQTLRLNQAIVMF